MKDLTFRLAGVTLPAGKYKPGAARDGNEDALFVNLDLSDKKGLTPAPDALYELGDAGTIMVVADGMGGMNAGEVASQIAIDTVRAAFLPEVLTPEILATPDSRAAYMENTARRANQNILDNAAANPSRSGMGSTIIMAWLMPSGELTVTWVGDSRAYVYNPSIGVHPLSEDQSFVQQLVRKGLITYEQSFDHPQNNVIMHSLGDPSQPCNPETRQFNVGKGDILLICSDGLTGVLRDKPGKNPATGQPYPEENLQDLIKENAQSTEGCMQALVKAAERGKWYDNVTVVLCEIVDGPKSQVAPQVARNEKALAKVIRESKSELAGSGLTSGGGLKEVAKSKKGLLIGIGALVALGIVCWICFFGLSKDEEKKADTASVEQNDPASKSEEITDERGPSSDNTQQSQTALPQIIQGPSSAAQPSPQTGNLGNGTLSTSGNPTVNARQELQNPSGQPHAMGKGKNMNPDQSSTSSGKQMVTDKHATGEATNPKNDKEETKKLEKKYEQYINNLLGE